MTEKKLYLLQFTSIYVAKLGTSPPKIMRCKMIEFHSLGTVPDHIPDDVLGDARSPGCPVTTNGPEDSAGRDRHRCQPPVYGTLDPYRHGNCADVIALADEVYDRPMPLPNLNIFLPQGCQLSSAQTTAEQDRDHSDVSDIAKARAIRLLKERLGLLAVELVSRPAAELLYAFDTRDPSSEFRTQQTRVRRFVGESPDGR
jgi:hypothetical protein